MKRLIGYLLFILMLSMAAFANSSDQLLQKIQLNGFVNDFAGVISDAEKRQMTAIISELQQKTGAEIAIVTLSSLNDGQIDDFSIRLAEKWQIGQKGKDNGLLILTAMKEHKIRIEVGYGLEGAIPDSKAGRIRRDVITPYFKAGKPGAGLLAGVSALSMEVATEDGVTLTGVQKYHSTASRSSGRRGHSLLSFIFIIGFVIFAIRHPFLAMMLLSSGGNYRSGGGGFGGGSGGGGFGGGSFGGGGSTGGW